MGRCRAQHSPRNPVGCWAFLSSMYFSPSTGLSRNWNTTYCLKEINMDAELCGLMRNKLNKHNLGSKINVNDWGLFLKQGVY